ncbi:MAG TPA: NAD(P)/FAD-dependent oxidoreductase [Anaerolineales bacterium]|jgi:NADH dehydrogenase
MDTKQIVIIGAGFGGLRAAQKLAGKDAHVTLVDRRNYHLFQPLLYQVATAGLSPDEIAYPLRAIFRKQKNLEFLLAEVTGVDLPGKRVLTERGPLAYDALIIAAGAAVNFFGNPSLTQNALTLKDVGDAVRLRNHVLSMFELATREPDGEKRRALLTFVVVGGGPTGVESAGAFVELIRLVLRRDYPGLNMDNVRVVLLEAADNLLAGFPPKLQRNALKVLAAKHVEVKLGAKVDGYDGEKITLANGSSIASQTLLWSAGVRVAGLIDTLGVKQARLGRVIVTPELQLPEYPEVYVIGDAAYLEDNGIPLPMMAPVAIQQAELAVDNILAQDNGEKPKSFVYRDPGSLATIGRNEAVARLGRWQFTGFPAWVVWLVVHLIGLIGFRNRLIVLINWAWDYFFYDRAVRLITRE